MISLFIQHSYENILTSLGILAFLHHITLSNCVFSNVYTLNLQQLVYISSDKEHEVKILVAQWLTYLLQCFLHLSYSYLLAIRRRLKRNLNQSVHIDKCEFHCFRIIYFALPLKKGKMLRNIISCISGWCGVMLCFCSKESNPSLNPDSPKSSINALL